ncbi:MAG: DUF3050 domain-containing protein [Cytophagales bacterium]|nr:DUF3050 domain-containing protein [Bernardetiaceae bacterium]MDW8205929.1 DUF3050 domain-containing protein [Cytophagales bacterium]
MNSYISQLQASIAPLSKQVVNHPVYAAIRDVESLHAFMQYHVFAVWDFMSLLKALQNNLTCTRTPWFPEGNANTRFLINEIVVGEESDVDFFGNRKSHFEMYLDAMQQCGADTSAIEMFTATLQQTGNLEKAFEVARVPEATRQFVRYTFEIINSNQPHVQAAVFTFGREDLIPQMFLSIINGIFQDTPEKISLFKYYLERHIEVDGDHHSLLALEMTAHLCGDDAKRWQQATEAAQKALQMRIALWDGVLAEIEQAIEA